MTFILPESLSVVGTYAGGEDPQGWLDHFQAVADLYQWNEALWTKVGALQLRGSAQLWARRRQFTHWLDFCQQLKQRFGETVESAACRLEQCLQQDGESPRTFADRFLGCAAKAGRCEDPLMLWSFIQHLLPELREEALRQRLHSIADVMAFCEYWLTAQADLDTWEQFDHCSPGQPWELPDNAGPASNQQEHALHFQECYPVGEFNPLPSRLDSLKRWLLQIEERQRHVQEQLQEQLHAKDLEIYALMATLAEPALQQQEQHPGSDNSRWELLAFTDVAEAPVAGLSPTQPEPTMWHPDAGGISTSPLVMSSTSGPTASTLGDDNSSLSLTPETSAPPSRPVRHGPSPLQGQPSTQDEAAFSDKPLGTWQHGPGSWQGMPYWERPDLDYTMLAWYEAHKVTFPLLPEDTALSPASIQDSGGTNAWLQVAQGPNVASTSTTPC